MGELMLLSAVAAASLVVWQLVAKRGGMQGAAAARSLPGAAFVREGTGKTPSLMKQSRAIVKQSAPSIDASLGTGKAVAPVALRVHGTAETLRPIRRGIEQVQTFVVDALVARGANPDLVLQFEVDSRVADGDLRVYPIFATEHTSIRSVDAAVQSPSRDGDWTTFDGCVIEQIDGGEVFTVPANSHCDIGRGDWCDLVIAADRTDVSRSAVRISAGTDTITVHVPREASRPILVEGHEVKPGHSRELTGAGAVFIADLEFWVTAKLAQGDGA